MSTYLIAAPEALAAASADVSGIGEAIRKATASWAPSTTGIAAAAADEVSAAIARLFGNYAQGFVALDAQAAAFEQQFAAALSAGAGAYASAEAVNLSALQSGDLHALGESLLAPINGPVMALTGRPLIGNGANGAPGTGAAGAAGGWLLGDGGAGG
ncbi:PE domain-containing protein, partial [Mycobacterium gordonae]|uniref:PE domain-containing protein n=1 Tax=Mycobacterium gordonae TaxID=1778 RepID=UPI001151E22A